MSQQYRDPKQKTQILKSQVFLKNTKISVLDTLNAKTGGAQRGPFSGFGKGFSTFYIANYNAKKAPGGRGSARRYKKYAQFVPPGEVLGTTKMSQQ